MPRARAIDPDSAPISAVANDPPPHLVLPALPVGGSCPAAFRPQLIVRSLIAARQNRSICVSDSLRLPGWRGPRSPRHGKLPDLGSGRRLAGGPADGRASRFVKHRACEGYVVPVRNADNAVAIASVSAVIIAAAAALSRRWRARAAALAWWAGFAAGLAWSGIRGLAAWLFGGVRRSSC
jgi:hypothetical protein